MLVASALSFATLGATHARAQAMLTFSGGNGAPLSLTLNTPVTYAITGTNSRDHLFFDLQGTGDLFYGPVSFTGSITYSTPVSITVGVCGQSMGDIMETDLILFNAGSYDTVYAALTVQLLAGSLTTTGSVAATPPASGSYQTFITNYDGSKIDSANGVSAAPEPSTWAAMIACVGLLGLALRRRFRVV